MSELQEKQKRLLYRFGEWVYRLHEKGELEFLYPGSGGDPSEIEKETGKMLKLLGFMEERIRKFGDDPAVSQEVCCRQEGPDECCVGQWAEKKVEEVEVKPAGLPEAENIDIESLPSVAPMAEPEAERTPGSYHEILESAKFKFEAQKRLFEGHLELLKCGNDTGREKALKNIAYFCDRETLKKVFLVAMNEPSAYVRAAVLKAVGRMADAERAVFYQKGLKDEDSEIRIAAVKGLCQLLLKDSLLWIEPMLRDPDSAVRRTAVTYLGLYGGPQGVRAIVDLCGDGDASVRKNLVEVLAAVRSAESFSVFKRLIQDPDQAVRQAVECALAKIRQGENRGTRDGKRQSK